MPIAWDYDDDVPALRNQWELIRCPRKGKIHAIILSTWCEAVWTHYYGGRTQPCRGDGCAMCAEQGTRRRHVYLGIWHPADNMKHLLELTDRAGATFLKRRKENLISRGIGIKVERVGPRPNSPVIVTLGEDHTEKYKLPDEPEIRTSLRIIWHLHSDPTAYDDAEKTTFVRGHHRKKESTNGGGSPPANGSAGPERNGRSRRTDQLHEPQPQANHLPSRTTIEPAHD